MNFFPDFAPNSRKYWRVSLFQSNLRKQIRNLPKILKFVRIVHYYSKLFTGVLSITPIVAPRSESGRIQTGKTENGVARLRRGENLAGHGGAGAGGRGLHRRGRRRAQARRAGGIQGLEQLQDARLERVAVRRVRLLRSEVNNFEK